MRRAAQGAALWIVLAGLPGAVACNMLTGADDVRITDDDDGSSSSSAGGAAAAGQQSAAGVGGATATTNGSTSTTTAASGAGAGPTNCEYPTGPYSVAQGGVVPPTISWQGFVPNSTTVSTISMQDLFDCDGTRGIDAIIIDTSQFG